MVGRDHNLWGVLPLCQVRRGGSRSCGQRLHAVHRWRMQSVMEPPPEGGFSYLITICIRAVPTQSLQVVSNHSNQLKGPFATLSLWSCHQKTPPWGGFNTSHRIPRGRVNRMWSLFTLTTGLLLASLQCKFFSSLVCTTEASASFAHNIW